MSDAGYEPSPWRLISDHVQRYLDTDGDDGFEWEGAKCVILTTVGRKTGSLRRSPLIRIRDGNRYIVVGSMGGAPRHPDWYLNLVANGDVTIQDRDEIHRLTARTATGEERAELWALALREWPDYAQYQTRTDREFPLVVCE